MRGHIFASTLMRLRYSDAARSWQVAYMEGQNFLELSAGWSRGRAENPGSGYSEDHECSSSEDQGPVQTWSVPSEHMTTRKLIPCFQQAVLLIGIAALLNGCGPKTPNASTSVPAALNARPGEHFYATSFPLAENPISERGAWVGGSSAGASIWAGGKIWNGGRLWGNVQTAQGVAYGVDEPTEFGDPTAILAGAWGPTQTVIATVRVNK